MSPRALLCSLIGGAEGIALGWSIENKMLPLIIVIVVLMIAEVLGILVLLRRPL
jgi:hypothetical protein